MYVPLGHGGGRGGEGRHVECFMSISELTVFLGNHRASLGPLWPLALTHLFTSTVV